MSVIRISRPGALLLSLWCVTAAAQPTTSLESDWMELVRGHKGKVMGVEVRDIAPQDSDGVQRVTFAVPKSAVANPRDIEEVVVVGRRPQAREPLKVRFEWLEDYDSDNYGLVVHIGESSWPLRLYLNSAPGFPE
jgi:hypothetical protein